MKLNKGRLYLSVFAEDAVIIHLAEAFGSGIGLGIADGVAIKILSAEGAGVGTGTAIMVIPIATPPFCVILSATSRAGILNIEVRETELSIWERDTTLGVERWLKKC